MSFQEQPSKHLAPGRINPLHNPHRINPPQIDTMKYGHIHTPSSYLESQEGEEKQIPARSPCMREGITWNKYSILLLLLQPKGRLSQHTQSIKHGWKIAIFLAQGIQVLSSGQLQSLDKGKILEEKEPEREYSNSATPHIWLTFEPRMQGAGSKHLT